MSNVAIISKEEAEYARAVIEAYEQQQKESGENLPPDVKSVGFFICKKIVKKDGTMEKFWTTKNLALCEVIGLFEIIKYELIVGSKQV